MTQKAFEDLSALLRQACADIDKAEIMALSAKASVTLLGTQSDCPNEIRLECKRLRDCLKQGLDAIRYVGEQLMTRVGTELVHELRDAPSHD